MKLNALPLLAVAPLALLAACGEETVAQPEPKEPSIEEQLATPTIPPPDAEIFASLLAKTCPDMKPVSTSACKRAGMGSPEVICEFGLGDDEYLRNKTTLVQGESEWKIADAETTCAIGA